MPPLLRGSWFDKLTMRESEDATLIAEIADRESCRTCSLHHPSPSW
ncbi:hypothetical protein SAMN05443582_103457 [Phyllobacterium sp. OV277]|nr:hypothetical protein SAMN05443582_103457 [Phyllobacterium sp. OV277]